MQREHNIFYYTYIYKTINNNNTNSKKETYNNNKKQQHWLWHIRKREPHGSFGIRNRRKLEYKIKNYISAQSLHMQAQNEGEGKEGSRMSVFPLPLPLYFSSRIFRISVFVSRHTFCFNSDVPVYKIWNLTTAFFSFRPSFSLISLPW